jgi:type I restriction enzyme M protein
LELNYNKSISIDSKIHQDSLLTFNEFIEDTIFKITNLSKKLKSEVEDEKRVFNLKEKLFELKNSIDLHYKLLNIIDQVLIDLEHVLDFTKRKLISNKHTIRQYLGGLNSMLEGTKEFIIKNNVICPDMIYSKNAQITFKQHLKSSVESFDDIFNLLITRSDICKISEVINVKELVLNCMNKFSQDTIFKFTKYEIIDNNIYYDDFKPFVSINKEDFEIIFSNIIQNAIDHGFKNKSKNENLIDVFITGNSETVIIEIANNGEKLADNFTVKNLITRGDKTTDSQGTGIGGSDIYQNVEKYKGKLELISDSKNMFPVRYIISFSNVKIEKI